MVRNVFFLFSVGFLFSLSSVQAQENYQCNERKVCGGFLGLGCEAGMHCVDIANDSCDPKLGGADCLGVCAADKVAIADCRYGRVVKPVAESRALAEEQLSTLNPNATLVWSSSTGTFRRIENLDYEVKNCSGQKLIYNQLKQPLLIANSKLFQLKISEWSANNLTCEGIQENQEAHLRIERQLIGRHTIKQDYMILVLKKTDGILRVKSIIAQYLPRLSAKLDADLAACPDLSLGEAINQTAKQEFGYTVYKWCIPLTSGTYSPNQYDRFEFDSDRLGNCSDTTWRWEEASNGSGIIFKKNRSGVLQIGPENIDSKIEASDLNCPVYGSGSERIFGYELGWDSVTGEVLYSKRGIGCIVC